MHEGWRAGGRTHTTKLIVAFRNFANAPTNDQLILFREIIAVCSEINIKHINTVCGQNVEFVNVTLVAYKVATGL